MGAPEEERDGPAEDQQRPSQQLIAAHAEVLFRPRRGNHTWAVGTRVTRGGALCLPPAGAFPLGENRTQTTARATEPVRMQAAKIMPV